MQPEPDIITPMHKIALAVSAGSNGDQMDLTPTPLQATLVLGVGRDGLTPLELELLGKRRGERIHLSVDPRRFEAHLAPLSLPPLLMPAGIERLHLELQINDFSPATPQEVIRALAAIANAGGGCGGDCGCGCGTH